MICPNLNDPLIKQEFDELVAAIGENAAYNKWNFYEGNVPRSEYVVTEEESEEEDYIPSFKPKPSNRISILKQQEFKNDLRVGETAQPFLYWSETTSKQVSEKGVIVDRILDDRFEGRYIDTGEERTFKFSNVIDESIDRGMTRNQQRFYKSTLALGQDITIETQQETYEGEVVEIGEEEVQIKDANDNIIAIPYKMIFKPDAQMNLAKLVQKLKETFSTQLQIYSRSAKSVEQQKRVDSYNAILSVLENYNQVEDFTVFLKEVNENLFRAKAVLDRIVKNESVESNEKKLYIISYVKDLLNSYKEVSKIQTIIEDFEGSEILKSYMNKFYSNYSVAKNTYERIAVPQLAELLWDYFDPKMNDKLIAVGEKPYTKQRLIDDLSDPERDIDFFNQVFIAPSNVNDVVMGLFVKMIKGGKEKARMDDFKFLNKISPIIEKLKAKYGEEGYKNILSTFYTIEPVTIKDNDSDEEKVINVRKFIASHNFQPFYDTVLDYKTRIDNLVAKRLEAEAALVIEFTPEMNAVRMDAQAEEALLRRERRRYYEEYGTNVPADKFKKQMDKAYTWDSEEFYKNLKKYYTQVTDTDLIQELDPDTSISFRNDFTGEIEHYSRNEVKRSEPNPEKFVTPAWEKVVLKNPDQDISDLLKALVEEYDSVNRKLPYTKRIKNNIVPALRNEESLFDLKQTWDKVSTALAEGNLIEKVTGKIKKEFLEFWKSDQPVYQRRIDGKPYREIPISVTSVMDASESSEDIVMSTLMFIKSANNFAYMNDFVGSTEVITEMLTENDPLNEEQPERVKEEINKRKEALLAFFNQQVYGEFNTSYGPLAKVIDFLGKATAITTIGLNPKSWLANFFVGNWNNLAEGFGDRFYSVSDIMWADKQFMKMIANPEQREILMNMIDSLDAIQGRYSKTFGDKLMSFKEKYGRLDTLFIGQDLAELQIQGSVMLAMLKRNNIPYPEKGIFTEENTPDLQNFKNLLHAINKRNHGVYSEFDRLHFQSNAVFRLFLQFRKWVVSTFRARYMGALSGEYRMDIEMGSIEKGWYRLFYEYFKDSLNNGMSLVEAIKDINNPNLTDVQREGIRRTLVDFLGFAIGSLLVLAMTWGDDDEEDFFGEYFIVYYLKRLIGEIGVYLPFLGFSDKLRMVANPFGAAGTLKDIISLFSLVMDFELDKDGNVSIFKEYQRDTGRFEEGDLKLWGKLSKLNAADNFLQVQDFKQLIENYEAASRM